MKSTLVPSIAPSWVAPVSASRIRNDLAVAQEEMASGRHADVGLKLGRRTGLTVEARSQTVLVKSLKDSASLAATRLEVIQSSLSQLSEHAEDIQAALVASRSGQASAGVLLPQTRAALEGLFENLNISVHGVHVFGGVETDGPPFEDYFADSPPSSRQAVNAAFLAEFGFDQEDPAVASITASSMESFLDNAFADLFETPAWENDWSAASDSGMKTLVSLEDVVETTASANAPAMRKLAMAYTMVSDLGMDGLNDAAASVVIDKAIRTIGEALGDLNSMRGEIGVDQERIASARERLSAQEALLEREIAGMESVDLYEMATRVNMLTSQLETAYTLTGRLQQMSLLRFL